MKLTAKWEKCKSEGEKPRQGITIVSITNTHSILEQYKCYINSCMTMYCLGNNEKEKCFISSMQPWCLFLYFLSSAGWIYGWRSWGIGNCIFQLSLGTGICQVVFNAYTLFLQQVRKVNLLEKDSSIDKVRNMRALRELFFVLNQQFSTCIWTRWGEMILSRKSLKTDICTVS